MRRCVVAVAPRVVLLGSTPKNGFGCDWFRYDVPSANWSALSYAERYNPDVVIAMNPVYRAEIAADLARLGVAAELLTL